MPDVDLGVLVHALISSIKSAGSQRIYPAIPAQNCVQGMHYAPR